MDVPLTPLLPGLFPTTNSMFRGSGILYWLSSKAGLINCSKPVHATVSFQIKDFCDSGVTDLTQYLRVGFRLAFHAVPNKTSEWIANYVSPISEQDLTSGVTDDNQELNIEPSFETNNVLNGKNSKDNYSLEKEMRALYFLLGIFQKSGQHYIPLSNLHSRISNSGDPELSRYIGSSSLKRRQFIEDRSYIFMLADNDVICLQAPEIYQTVTLLADYLLKHGGVTSSDLLFSFFNKCVNIPISIKEGIQNRRPLFMQFLSRHPFAFAPFPSQYFVAVRRTLPFFEYSAFIRRITSTSAISGEKKILSNGGGGGLTFNAYSNANFQPRSLSRPLLQSAESFDGGNQQQIEGLVGQLSSINSWGNVPSIAGSLVNGFNSNPNGCGGVQQQQQRPHHLVNNNNNIGGGIIGGGQQQHSSFLHNNHHQQTVGNISTPITTSQKPLFSLFDDPIISNNSNILQNGGDVCSIMSGSSSINGSNSLVNNNVSTPSVTTTTSNNIWTYDIDFFDRSKICEVFSNDFNNLTIGKEQKATSPKFVEKEIQTDESLFTYASVCSNCAKKMSK